MIRFVVKDEVDEARLAKIQAGMEDAITAVLFKIWQEAVKIILHERTDTGHMADSTIIERTGPLSGMVSTNTNYAEYQHEGFWHVRAGRFIPGVPWFEMALREAKPQFIKDIEKAII